MLVSCHGSLALCKVPDQFYLFQSQQLFKQKLELCCVIFNFDSVSSDKRCGFLQCCCGKAGMSSVCSRILVNRGKELKRVTLLELVDYVNSAGGQKVSVGGCRFCRLQRDVRHGGCFIVQIFTDTVIPDIIRMISVNIFRALPPQVSVPPCDWL
jgi:serine/threonine-protein phosphatase 2A regulatory subunit B'